ncbi:MAG: ferrochelatase [Bryobacteraceae bacterium]
MGDTAHLRYDAILIVSFGGPEKAEDVMPFLENVVRGRNVPRERLIEVAQHYYHMGGRSPINDQNRALTAALKDLLAREGPDLPVYWGNRNWHPMLPETLRQMRDDGVRRSLGFFTSAYSSYSGCRQYREDIERAQERAGPGAPVVDKIRVFYNHPLFIAAAADHVLCALNRIPPERRAAAHIAYTAHSIPVSMAKNCRYETQLLEACRLVSAAAGSPAYRLVYQSRSGPAAQPWLEPDICDHLRSLSEAGIKDVVIAPIGFISDHLEILYDLDREARNMAAGLGLNMIRASTVGAHPDFVRMVRQLILERIDPAQNRAALGLYGPDHDVCPPDCCLPGTQALTAGGGIRQGRG